MHHRENVLQMPNATKDCGHCRAPCPLRESSAGEESIEGALTISRRRLPAGTELYRQGDADDLFYIVSCGWVCLYKLLSDGRRYNAKFAMPGDILTIQFESDAETDHSAVALTDITVCAGSQSSLNALLAERPELLRRIGGYLVHDHALAMDGIANVARASADERVANLLLRLFLRARRRLPVSGDGMAIPLTQEQMGDAVGLSAVHVNRMLSRMRNEGILVLVNGWLTINDPERLAALSKLDAPATLRHLIAGRPAFTAMGDSGVQGAGADPQSVHV